MSNRRVASLCLLWGMLFLLPFLCYAEEIKVMSYNILFGGMAGEHLYDTHNRDRVPELVELLRSVGPDILAISEACNWHTAEYPSAAAIAAELKMNYVITSPGYDPNASYEYGYNAVVLFSKYEIIEFEEWPNLFFNGAMRVALRLTSGGILHVFVAHLTPNRTGANSEWLRQQEAKHLVEAMEQHADSPSILIGDLNYRATDLSRCKNCPTCCMGATAARVKPGEILEEAGWILIAYEEALGGLEQAWVSSTLSSAATVLAIGVEKEHLYRLSDHLPVIIELVVD